MTVEELMKVIAPNQEVDICRNPDNLETIAFGTKSEICDKKLKRMLAEISREKLLSYEVGSILTYIDIDEDSDGAVESSVLLIIIKEEEES